MDAVLDQEPIVSFLQSKLADPPHILLCGVTGIGKTMLANAWITAHLESQGVTNPAHQAIMTLRLSSADDRGIAAIRQRLTEFVRRVRPVANAVAWVLLDDADNLPVVTQQALRRILELHAHQTRFCFVAQSCEHFIEPIQSRCVMLRCNPVDLVTHGPAILAIEAPSAVVSEDSMNLMAGMCMGNARQFALMCRALATSSPSSPSPPLSSPLSPLSSPSYSSDISMCVNAPPVPLLLRLQNAIIQQDLNTITECVLVLWSKGYSFEDCIAMLEMVVRVYNDTINTDLQHVLQTCAEGHIFQILNRMTTLDLIAIFSGHASAGCLAEPVTV